MLRMKPIVPLEPAEQSGLLKLCGILSRPELTEEHQQSLRGMVADARWRPLSFLSSLDMLVPLYRHHITRAGLEWEQVFCYREYVRPEPSTAELVSRWYQLRGLLEELFAGLAAAGVDQVLAVKGTATAPLYSSPALRQMCDADLMIPADMQDAALDVFERLGWAEQNSATSLNFRHQSGFMIDLKVPRNPCEEELLASGVPHTSWEAENVMCPPPAWQVLIHAWHTSDGMRVWRDVCDAHMFLPGEDARCVADEALAIARRHDHFLPVISFFRFLNAHSPAGARLPGRLPDEWSDQQEAHCRRQVTLFEKLAADRISVVAYNFLRLSLSPIGRRDPARSTARYRRPRTTSNRGWAERDPEMGTVPRAGTLRRQFLKARVVLHYFFSPQWGHYRRLMKLQREVKLGSRETSGRENTH